MFKIVEAIVRHCNVLVCYSFDLDGSLLPFPAIDLKLQSFLYFWDVSQPHQEPNVVAGLIAIALRAVELSRALLYYTLELTEEVALLAVGHLVLHHV